MGAVQVPQGEEEARERRMSGELVGAGKKTRRVGRRQVGFVFQQEPSVVTNDAVSTFEKMPLGRAGSSEQRRNDCSCLI